ncbi:outer membrane protein OmpA-like peptidoglycan-associated protein [Lewinella marina]|uniref:OmpA family protein n=1 Tax=Neolewinella marina TaxID=438751 RepID=UPI00143054D3|nr:OmpA family protein [Neolewinella marina]NJB87355.1 outer membrane protein OmpA-like peptidoglycan-associated protein [Neolewinella marina]
MIVLVLILCTTGLTAQGRIGPEDVRERDPVLTDSGQILYFTRPDHPRNQGIDDRADIWFRQRNANGSWGRALNPGSPVNSFGDDRLLGSSVDGNRLAVLREGQGEPAIELLERAGRSWRSIARWPLPQDVTELREIAFNATSQELVYARPNPANASRDLYLRRATAGSWTTAKPLAWVNTSDHETKPQWAADGRTLYFRRGAGQWYRQVDRGTPPQSVDIPSRYLQLAATDEIVVATTDDLGQDERLVAPGLPLQALCPPGRISYGTLGTPPPAGTATVQVPLSSGVEVTVRPDVLHRYAVVVREGEVAFPESNVPALTDVKPAGSLASLRDITTENREAYLQRTLEERQRELRRLDQLRRLRYTGGNAGPASAEEETDDVQWLAADTLPPADTSASFRARYARELAELERMKAKFRRQQEDRLRERQRGEYLDLGWSDRPGEPDTTEYINTDALRSTVRSGLYPDQRPPADSRRPWEYDVRGAAPQPQPATTELDAEYARQQRELEALRAQLREMNATPQPRQQAPARPTLTGKSPAAPVVAPSGSQAARSGITFIPNTAYPNSAGYAALEALAGRVRTATRVVEIRVHTVPGTDPRAAQLLSEERAVTIRNYLREAGIAPANFRVIGYGNHQPEGGERVEVVE